MNRFQQFCLFCSIFISTTIAANDLNDTETILFNKAPYENYWDISGYIKVLADVPTDNRNAEVELDDLSVFVSGNVNKWLNPFVEAEYFSGTLWQSKGNRKFTDGKFIFERLYNDFKFSQNSQLRVGKFLAPVGFWNLIHAAPLVWTVNRPISSTYSYSNYITGVEYGHLFNAMSGERFDVYVQLTKEFDPKPLSKHPRRYDKILGGSWTLADNLDTRASFDIQYAEVETSQSKRLTASFQKIWYLRSWDIDTQFIYTRITNSNAKFDSEDMLEKGVKNDDAAAIDNGWDGGGYIQARYRFAPKWNVYSRAEYFHFAVEKASGKNFIFGARYRIGKWGNINAEYKWGGGAQGIANDGLSVSYNAMFRW